jgi:DNA-binding NarL/FixJ family response regulator
MIDVPKHHSIRQISPGALGASELSMEVHQQAGLSPLNRDAAPIAVDAAPIAVDAAPIAVEAAPIAVIDEYSFTRGCTTKLLQVLSSEVDIISFATCDEACQSHKKFSLIIYNSQHYAKENFESAAWRELMMMAPAIVLSSDKGPDFIVDALRKGMRGYIPIESTTFDLAVEIFRMVMAGGSFVPLAVLPLRAAEIAFARPPILTSDLTAREKAVLALLKLGKMNKIIAFELKISESTVKVHIRNIMRKIKVNNRTEIVSRIFEASGISLMFSFDFVAALV